MNWPLAITWAFILIAVVAAIYFTYKQVKLLGG
jgi:hypothetical protein